MVNYAMAGGQIGGRHYFVVRKGTTSNGPTPDWYLVDSLHQGNHPAQAKLMTDNDWRNIHGTLSVVQPCSDERMLASCEFSDDELIIHQQRLAQEDTEMALSTPASQQHGLHNPNAEHGTKPIMTQAQTQVKETQAKQLPPTKKRTFNKHNGPDKAPKADSTTTEALKMHNICHYLSRPAPKDAHDQIPLQNHQSQDCIQAITGGPPPDPTPSLSMPHHAQEPRPHHQDDALIPPSSFLSKQNQSQAL